MQGPSRDIPGSEPRKGRFRMSEVPLCAFKEAGGASERRGNNLNGFKDFDLNAKARFWS